MDIWKAIINRKQINVFFFPLCLWPNMVNRHKQISNLIKYPRDDQWIVIFICMFHEFTLLQKLHLKVSKITKKFYLIFIILLNLRQATASGTAEGTKVIFWAFYGKSKRDQHISAWKCFQTEEFLLSGDFQILNTTFLNFLSKLKSR